MSLLALLLSYSVSFPAQPDIRLDITKNQKKQSSLVFIAPHENEFVANHYLKNKIKSVGGTFLILRQKGKRLIEFKLSDQTITIDPNRIFTPLGRKATLIKLNPNISFDSKIAQQALIRSKELAEFLLTTINSKVPDKKATWIAMHNNTNGYTGDGKNGEGTISVVRYQAKLENGSRFLIDVNRTDKDEDDLFYVTEKTDFNQMKKDGWNAVLENPTVKTDKSEDDGSLSVYANKSGIRYINIEAERKSKNGGKDHVEEKQKMIDYIYSLPQQ